MYEPILNFIILVSFIFICSDDTFVPVFGDTFDGSPDFTNCFTLLVCRQASNTFKSLNKPKYADHDWQLMEDESVEDLYSQFLYISASGNRKLVCGTRIYTTNKI